jgi:hypothetical protein
MKPPKMATFKTGLKWVGLYLLAQLIGGLVEATTGAHGMGPVVAGRAHGRVHHLRPRAASGAARRDDDDGDGGPEDMSDRIIGATHLVQ